MFRNQATIQQNFRLDNCMFQNQPKNLKQNSTKLSYFKHIEEGLQIFHLGPQSNLKPVLQKMTTQLQVYLR